MVILTKMCIIFVKSCFNSLSVCHVNVANFMHQYDILSTYMVSDCMMLLSSRLLNSLAILLFGSVKIVAYLYMALPVSSS